MISISFAQKDSCEVCDHHYHIIFPDATACEGGGLLFYVHYISPHVNYFTVDIQLNGDPHQAGNTVHDEMFFELYETGLYTVTVKCYYVEPREGLKTLPGGAVLKGTCTYNFRIDRFTPVIYADNEVNGIASDNTSFLGLTRCELEEMNVQWTVSPPSECSNPNVKHRYSLYKVNSNGSGSVLIENKSWTAGCPPSTPVTVDFFVAGASLESGEYFEIRLEIDHEGCVSTNSVRFRYMGEDGEQELLLGIGRNWDIGVRDGSQNWPSGYLPLSGNEVKLYVIPNEEEDDEVMSGSLNTYLVIHNIMKKNKVVVIPGFVDYYEVIKDNIVQIDIELEGSVAGFILTKTIYPPAGLYKFWDWGFNTFSFNPGTLPNPYGATTTNYFGSAYNYSLFNPASTYSVLENVYTANVDIHISCDGGVDIFSGSVDFTIDGSGNGSNYRPELPVGDVIDSDRTDFVRLFDMNGRLVKTVPLIKDWRLNLSGNLPNGIYAYRFMDGAELMVGKIFVE